MTRFDDLSYLVSKSSGREFVKDAGPASVEAILLKSGRRRPVPTLVNEQNEHASREEIADVIASARRGSEVRVVDNTNRPYRGLLSSSGPEGVTLVTCVFTEIVRGLPGRTQSKTSYVPFQSFELQSIESLEILSPPGPGFVMPEYEYAREEFCLMMFVFGNGLVQERGLPPERSPFSLANGTLRAE